MMISLLPDLHITRAGVLRAELRAHQEHVVAQDAHAADRKKVSHWLFDIHFGANSSSFSLWSGSLSLHRDENVWVDSKVGFLHALFRFTCTSHAVSPRPELVKLLALSNFPAFVHCDPCFTGLYGQCCLTLCDTLCHRCFLLLDQMRLLSPVSRTQWLLCADPPFFCAPLMTWLRNGFLVSDALFLGGLICLRICLINSFHCFGQWSWMFLLLFTNGNCPFRFVVADWRANRPGHVP